MSGGHFQYKQYDIDEIIDEIEYQIKENEYALSERVIEQFKQAVFYLKVGVIHTQRIDWLLSGDDSEETFFKRLEEDLNKGLTND